jgi:hypothetical protein
MFLGFLFFFGNKIKEENERHVSVREKKREKIDYNRRN